MEGVVISVYVMLAILQLMVKQGQATVSCHQVNECLSPCVAYLTSGTGNPTAQCCGGVGRLQKIAETTADKQEACNCIKQAAARFPTIKEDAASSLPANCNAQINSPI
ncbi:non-specific lipid-transfer protein A-like [Herrania umbratica]|uniref:Non-specific lipid-transfer protein n=1 Tax=Herrania umbratica TaxID=108875 RepID=A0A6J0ZYN9_9ROSI|nr:non-specific lipid-transfer protein A-like [Herrania umbratica]